MKREPIQTPNQHPPTWPILTVSAKMIRAAVRTVSVILGLCMIAVTLFGHVRYQGFDSPYFGLMVGFALIVTPGSTLVMVLTYFTLIVLLVISGIVVGALFSRLLGTFGAYLGFTLGLALGCWIAAVSRGFELAGKVGEWIDRKP